MTQAADAAPAVRPASHRDGHAVPSGRLARRRRRGHARHLPRRRAGQRRPGDQRHHRRVADHDRRREGDPAAGRASRRSATGRTSSPASAPTTPTTRSSWPGRPRRPAPTGCSSSRRTTTSRRRPASLRHFTAVADATGCRCMVYDIPGRTGTPIETETLCRLAEHERIVGGQGRQGRPGRDVVGHRAHRPRLLLRRRPADPAAAAGRRRSAWSAPRPTSFGPADARR